MENAIQEWIDHHMSSKTNDDLWNLSSAILTELSERDSVQYRIRATDESLAQKLEQEVNTDG